MMLPRIELDKRIAIFFEIQLNHSYAGFPLGEFVWREQAKSECDWLVLSSVFVASQSCRFFLCSREQIRLVENRLYSN